MSVKTLAVSRGVIMTLLIHTTLLVEVLMSHCSHNMMLNSLFSVVFTSSDLVEGFCQHLPTEG